MRLHIHRTLLLVVLITLFAVPMAGAGLTPMNPQEMDSIHARAGSLNIGVDSLPEGSAFLTANEQENEESGCFNKTYDQMNIGLLEDKPVFTFSDVRLSGRIDKGRSYVTAVPGHTPENFTVHCHFENFDFQLDRFSAAAIRPGGMPDAPSFGALYIKGGGMEISGDVYIRPLP